MHTCRCPDVSLCTETARYRLIKCWVFALRTRCMNASFYEIKHAPNYFQEFCGRHECKFNTTDNYYSFIPIYQSFFCC